MWRLFTLALACVLGGCSSALPPAGPGTPDDVRSVRLFNGAGDDWTAHVFLLRSDTLRLEVRLYGDDGRQISSVAGGLELTITFTPPSLAVAAAVPNEPLVQAITTTAPLGTPGKLDVTLRFLATGSVATFGPFDCLVH